MRKRYAAFSKENLSFTIPLLFYLAATALLAFLVFGNLFDISHASDSGRIYLLGVYTGLAVAEKMSFTPLTVIGFFQVVILPIFLLVLYIVYLKKPKRWTKISIVITISEWLLWIIGAALLYEWYEWHIAYGIFFLINTLLLAPMILHLICKKHTQ